MPVRPHSGNFLSMCLFLHDRLFSLHVPDKCHKNALLLSTDSVLSSHTCRDFYILCTVHLSKILDNDQLDTQLLYFTICLL